MKSETFKAKDSSKAIQKAINSSIYYSCHVVLVHNATKNTYTTFQKNPVITLSSGDVRIGEFLRGVNTLLTK